MTLKRRAICGVGIGSHDVDADGVGTVSSIVASLINADGKEASDGHEQPAPEAAGRAVHASE